MRSGRPSKSDRPIVRLFGMPRFEMGGATFRLPEKIYWLIAHLARLPNTSAKRAQIAQLLWGDVDHERGQANLRQMLARLRRVEVETGVVILHISGDSVGLSVDSVDVDLALFNEIDCHRLVQGRDRDALSQLCGIYCGDLLGEIAIDDAGFEDWLRPARQSARDRFFETIGAVLEIADFFPDAGERMALARQTFALDETKENICRVLMQLHAGQGDRVAALRAFQLCEAALLRELGLKPDPRTRALAARIRTALPDEAPAHTRSAVIIPFASASAGMTGAPQQEPALAAATPANIVPRLLIVPPVSAFAGPEALQLGTGLIEDVTVRLSQYRSFSIIAHHTAASIAKGGSGSAAMSARADYVLNTGLKGGERGLVMTLRLTRVADGEVLWANQIEWHPELLLSVFDLLVSRLVESLVDAIEIVTLRMPASAPEFLAYRLFLEGQRNLASIDLPDLRRARKLFRESCREAANYAAPLVGLSRSMIMEWLVLGTSDASLLNQSAELADRALEIDPFDWRGMRERGLACLYLRQHDESLNFFQRAIQHGPNDADLLADYADALAFAGEPEKGMQMCIRAMELNPITPGYYSWILGSILFQTKRYEEALRALEPVRANVATARLMAACSARAGRMDEARGYAAVVKENYPEFRTENLVRMTPNRRKEDMDHLVGGIRMAGLE